MSLKINTTQPKTENLETLSSVDKKSPGFNSILAQTHDLQDRELKLFLERLDQQGQKLAQTMSIQDLFEFKTMIKRFLKATFGKSRNMQEDTVWDFQGHPKVMARVTKINQYLEELGKQALSCQVGPLQILAKINEIKGLIVDLFA